jgi:hypothetical protein
MKYSKKVPIHHDSEDYYVFQSDGIIKDYHTPSLINYNAMIEDFNGIVEFYKSGKLKYRTYYEAGMKHRVGKPASYRFDASDEVHIYMQNNVLFREDALPTQLHYNSNKLYLETYQCEPPSGATSWIHRHDGPAVIWYGKLEIIPYWYLQNKNKTVQVNLWLEERDIHWQNMTKTDYLVMWPELEITYHDQKN